VEREDVGGVEVGPAGTGGVRPVGLAQGGTDDVAQRGEHRVRVAGTNLDVVFAEGDIADLVSTIFDDPVAA